MKLVETLSGWFADLQPREKLIITLGGALLVAAALYIALLPPWKKMPNSRPAIQPYMRIWIGCVNRAS